MRTLQRQRTPNLPRLVSSILMAIIAWGLVATPTWAQPRVPQQVETSGKHLITPATQRAIDNGLRFLAERQHADGSFGSGGMFRRNVGVTALCGMSFLSAGHTPGRGKYGTHVEKTVDFVLSRAKPNGFIVDDQSKSHGPMYGHGFATLFLAEAYGMSHGVRMKEKRKRLRSALEKAVKLIEDTQNREGGWRYYPQRQDADLSVTVCQVMALRAAKNSGIYVEKAVIDRAVEYAKRSQNADGGFRYQLTRRPDSSFPRSAAALVALYSAGIYKGREIENGLKFLSEMQPGSGRRGRMRMQQSHYFYGHYYAVQAMWHAGGDHWHRWYPAIRNELVTRQLGSGAWADSSICSEYGTAMSLLILQLPNNYLPIFQR